MSTLADAPLTPAERIKAASTDLMRGTRAKPGWTAAHADMARCDAYETALFMILGQLGEMARRRVTADELAEMVETARSSGLERHERTAAWIDRMLDPAVSA